MAESPRKPVLEAEVSEQTVYNHFQTKEQLVTDLDQEFQDEFSRLIRTRALATTPAAAIRELVLDAVEGIRRVPAEQWRGELGYLAAISPTVHRLALEMFDRQAATIATAISETRSPTSSRQPSKPSSTSSTAGLRPAPAKRREWRRPRERQTELVARCPENLRFATSAHVGGGRGAGSSRATGLPQLRPSGEGMATASFARGARSELSRLTWTTASEACFSGDITASAAVAIRAEAADVLALRSVNPSLRACMRPRVCAEPIKAAGCRRDGCRRRQALGPS